MTADHLRRELERTAESQSFRYIVERQLLRDACLVITRLQNTLRIIAGKDDDVTHTGDGHARCREIARRALNDY